MKISVFLINFFFHTLEWHTRVTVACTASGQKTSPFSYFFEDSFCFGVRRAFIWFGFGLAAQWKTKGFFQIKEIKILYFVPAK